MYNSVFWYIHSIVQLSLQSILEHFYHPKRNSLLSFSNFCQSFATTNLSVHMPSLEIHKNGILQCVLYKLLSFGIMLSRFIHFIACINNSFLFIAM